MDDPQAGDAAPRGPRQFDAVTIAAVEPTTPRATENGARAWPSERWHPHHVATVHGRILGAPGEDGVEVDHGHVGLVAGALADDAHLALLGELLHEAAGLRDRLREGGRADERDGLRGLDLAENEHAVGVDRRHAHGDEGLLEVLLVALDEQVPRLVEGAAGDVHGAQHRRRDRAVGKHALRGRDVLLLPDADGQLVADAEAVDERLRRAGDGGGRTGLPGTARGGRLRQGPGRHARAARGEREGQTGHDPAAVAGHGPLPEGSRGYAAGARGGPPPSLHRLAGAPAPASRRDRAQRASRAAPGVLRASWRMRTGRTRVR